MLTQQDKEKIKELMNPPENNFKDVNFIRFISRDAENYVTVEVGYWITYIGCRPKYNKEIRTFKL
jgi:hypothetical protein